MRVVILFAALAIPSSAPASFKSGSGPATFLERLQAQPTAAKAADERECVRAGVQMADERSPRPSARARRLDELPAGRLEFAVVREVDSCVIPAVVRGGYGR